MFDVILLLPDASVNTPAATLIVQAASVAGVNVAVYVVPDPAKLLNKPFVTLTSVITKSVVASLDVNVKAIDESFDVAPLDTVDDAIVIVGPVLS